MRDWLYVEDHAKAIDMVLAGGRVGEIYNIGGFNEEQNINIVKLTIDTIARLMQEEPRYRSVLKTSVENINYDLITYVSDRLGHDMRYAIDPSKTAPGTGLVPRDARLRSASKKRSVGISNIRSGSKKSSAGIIKNITNRCIPTDNSEYYERNRFGRWFRYASLPDNDGGQQTDVARLR